MPRAEVIDRAWRRLGPGLEPLSSPDGGPLSRTVKLIVLPLVLRPSARREFAATTLSGPDIESATELIVAERDRLIVTGQWFVLLRDGVDRSARDALYPRAYELAAVHGAPEHGSAGPLLDEVWAELSPDAWTPEAVRAVLEDAGLAAGWQRRLAEGWAATEVTDQDEPVSLDRSRVFLRAMTPRPAQADGAAWADLVEHQDGRGSGRALRAGRCDLTARRLGLTDADPVRPPELDGTSGTHPWDRSVLDRVLGVLRHTPDRASLPEPRELIADELGRVAEPWELETEEARVLLLLAAVLALDVAESEDADGPGAQGIVAGMRRRESWIVRSRRQGSFRAPIDGADPGLAEAVAEWSDPVGPYLRRLWVRLHGAEVRGGVPVDAEDAQSLLLGAVRSALLDGRSRVRAALSRVEAR